MKKAFVVLLVVVVIVSGLPILASMAGMASCYDCAPAVLAGACAVAILAAGVALLFAVFTQRLRSRSAVVRLLLHTFLLERPPRPA